MILTGTGLILLAGNRNTACILPFSVYGTAPVAEKYLRASLLIQNL